MVICGMEGWKDVVVAGGEDERESDGSGVIADEMGVWGGEG